MPQPRALKFVLGAVFIILIYTLTVPQKSTGSSHFSLGPFIPFTFPGMEEARNSQIKENPGDIDVNSLADTRPPMGYSASSADHCPQGPFFACPDTLVSLWESMFATQPCDTVTECVSLGWLYATGCSSKTMKALEMQEVCKRKCGRCRFTFDDIRSKGKRKGYTCDCNSGSQLSTSWCIVAVVFLGIVRSLC